MIDEPPTVGQMMPGEKFLLMGREYTVLENQGTRYVLCQHGKDVENLLSYLVIDEFVD